jgi:hypothetical protein
MVFAGTLLLGLVVLPLVGTATGSFATDAESAAFFSLATLKGLPYLLGGSILSVLIHPYWETRSRLARVALALLDVGVCWAVAAAIALARLG